MADTKIIDFELVTEEKLEYLKSLSSKIYKILHLIEEEKNGGYNPRDFIAGQLFEIRAARNLFGQMTDKLTQILIKLKGIYDDYGKLPFEECKK